MGVTQAARRPVPGGQPVLGIGEVLAVLRPEFGDLTISKLRFLEAEGLVEPLRAPSGYRKYTPEHVARLRLILTVQRDRYLPLRVIREQLAAIERGDGVPSHDSLPPASPLPSPSPSVATPPSPSARVLAPRSAPASPGASEAGGRRVRSGLTRAELVKRSGLDEAGLRELEQYGLLPPPVGAYYAQEALTVAQVAARLAQYGLQARHLRPHRASADREAGMLAQLLAPRARRGGAEGRQQALEMGHELAGLSAQLHGALVRHELRQVLGG